MAIDLTLSFAAKSEKADCIIFGRGETRFGDIWIAQEKDSIISLFFATFPEEEMKQRIRRMTGAKQILRDDDRFREKAEEISSYRGSHRVKMRATLFEQKVWSALAKVSYPISYSELAARAGAKNAVRACASAMARNPVSLILPCHRIIRCSGEVGNYAWGSEKKREILEYEKAHGLFLAPNLRILD